MTTIYFNNIPEHLCLHIQEFRGTPSDWGSPTAKCIKDLVGNRGNCLFSHFKLYNKMMRDMGMTTYQARKRFPPFERLLQVANEAFDERGFDDTYEYEVDDD